MKQPLSILFKTWGTLKEKIHQKKNVSKINEREVCFVNLGKNVGYEQDGKNENFERPVVALKKFGIFTFVGLPLTSKPKKGKFYFSFPLNGKTSYVLLSQIRLFDTRRIERKMGYMEKEDFAEMKEKLKSLLDL